MRRSILSALMSIAIICCFGQQQTDTIKWLKASAFDLKTVEPAIDITGIPFPSILGNVDLVLAGEATHGTREFARIKHRLFRYLVENLNFRYFFIEADFAAGLTVDNYICNGVGDPVEVLKNLRYFHIVNREGLEMIKWMRTYNTTRRPADQIRFFGFDCQSSDYAFKQLKTYIAKVDPVFFKQMVNLNLTNNSKWKTALDKKYPTLTLNKDSIAWIKDHLLASKDDYVSISQEKEFKMALMLVELLRRSHEIVSSGYSWEERENNMAANVEWLLNEIDPDPEKSFLWAHNGHVRYGEVTARATGLSYPTLGKLLHDRYGDKKVYSIIMTFNKGSFIANEVRRDTIVKKTYTVDQAPQNTFSYLLSRLNKEVLFFDFNYIKNPDLTHWLKNNDVRLQSNIGGVYYPDNRSLNYSLTENLNGLIFINDTNEITLDLRD